MISPDNSSHTGHERSMYIEPLPSWDLLSKRLGNGLFVFHTFGAAFTLLSCVSVYLIVNFQRKVRRRTNTLLLLVTIGVTSIVMGTYLMVDPYAFKGWLPIFVVNVLEQYAELGTIIAFIALQNDLLCLASVKVKWNKFQSAPRILCLMAFHSICMTIGELIYINVTQIKLIRLLSKVSLIFLSLYACVCFVCTGFKAAVYLDSMKSPRIFDPDDVSESYVNRDSDSVTSCKYGPSNLKGYSGKQCAYNSNEQLRLPSGNTAVSGLLSYPSNESISSSETMVKSVNHTGLVGNESYVERKLSDLTYDQDVWYTNSCVIKTEAAIHSPHNDIGNDSKNYASVSSTDYLVSHSSFTENVDAKVQLYQMAVAKVVGANNVSENISSTCISTKDDDITRIVGFVKLDETYKRKDGKNVILRKARDKKDEVNSCYLSDIDNTYNVRKTCSFESIYNEIHHIQCRSCSPDLKMVNIDSFPSRNKDDDGDSLSTLENGYMADGETLTINSVTSSKVHTDSDIASDDEDTDFKNASIRKQMLMASSSSCYSLIRLRQCAALQRVVSLGYFITFGSIVNIIFQMYSLFGVYGVFGSGRSPDAWPWFLFHVLHRGVSIAINTLLLSSVFFILNNRTKRRKRHRFPSRTFLDTRL